MSSGRGASFLTSMRPAMLLVLSVTLWGSVPVARAAEQSQRKNAGAQAAVVVAVVRGATPAPKAQALLEAAMSQRAAARKNLVVVDRQAIDRVLHEQALSAAGLTDSVDAVRVGKLVGADAVVIVEQAAEGKDGDGPRVAMRVVETRTGVILGSVQIPAAAAKVPTAIIKALAKVGRPIKARKYVGMMGVISEEPGTALEPLAESLASRASAALQRRPDVVVLEREQLQKLVTEHKLAGIQLDLRDATTLLAGGLRRDGDRLVVTWRASTMGAGRGAIRKITGKTNDPDALASRAAEAAVAMMGRMKGNAKKDDHAAAFSAKAEAAWFEKWSHQVGRPDRARLLAETALALDPSPKNHEWVFTLYRHESERSLLPMLQRLKAYQRANNVDLEAVRHLVDGQGPWARCGYDVYHVFGLNTHTLRVGANKPREQRLLDQIRATCFKKYRLLIRLYHDRRRDTAPLINQRLREANWLTDTPAELARHLRVTTVEMDSEIAAGHASGWARVTDGLTDAIRGCDRNYVNDSSKAMKRLLESWRKRRTFQLRVIGDYGLGHLHMAARGPLGRDILEQSFKYAATHGGYRPEVEGSAVIWMVESKVKAAGLAAILQREIVIAEKAGDPTSLVRCQDTVRDILSRLDKAQAEQLSQRVIALCKAHPEKARKAGEAHRFTRLIAHYIPKSAPAHRAPNPWDQYDFRPIPVTGAMLLPARKLLGVHLDRQALKAGKPALVVVWRTYPTIRRDPKNFQVVVTQVDPGTGKSEMLVKTHRSIYELNDVTSHGQTVYLATQRNGLWVIRDGRLQRFTQAHGGAPADTISHAAWLDGRVYLGLEDAMATFNPRTSGFELIGTRRSVEHHNLLDGGSPYRFTSLRADPDNHCLWFTLRQQFYDPKPNRTGLWRYQARGHTFQHVVTEDVGRLQWTLHGLMFANNADRLCLLNPRTGAVQQLQADTEYYGLAYKNRIGLLGGRILSTNAIDTFDGHIHRKPARIEEAASWFVPYQSGLLGVGIKNQRLMLWYITAKSGGDASGALIRSGRDTRREKK